MPDVLIAASARTDDVAKLEDILTSIDARNIASGILWREHDERATTADVDFLASHLKRLVARGRPPMFG